MHFIFGSLSAFSMRYLLAFVTKFLYKCITKSVGACIEEQGAACSPSSIGGMHCVHFFNFKAIQKFGEFFWFYCHCGRASNDNMKKFSCKGKKY